MSCPQVVKVITPGPPGAPGGAISMTGPAVIGRASGTGAAGVLPLGFGLAIVNGAMVVTATGATDLAYDPTTRLLSSSTGADVTLPLAGTAAGLVAGVSFAGPTGWTANASITTGSITLSLALPAGSSLVASSDRTSWNAAAALAATAIQPGNPTLSDARTPTSHAASHAAGGADAITPAAIGAATAAQGALAATAVQPAALSGYVQTADTRLSDAREWSAATISQADAEAGTGTDRRAFTAQRVFQAIAAWWAASSASAKLAGIQAGATANQADAYLLSRANHTGSQSASTISDSTTAGRALLTAADAAAQRTALGLGSLATQSGTFSGTSSGINTGDQTILLTGDVTGSGTGSFAATLASTAVTPGSYGSSSAVGTFTVDAKGRLTAASSVSISIASTAISDSSAAGRALLTGADAAAQRTTLGLGTAATTAASAYATAAQGAKADTAVQPATLASYAPLYPTRQTLTDSAGVYTIDVTSGQEFLTGAAIAGATTINLSGLASLPTNGVWRGVLRFSYTSGTVSWFTGNSGYTVKWDGGSAPTLTAGEQEAVIIEVVGGGTVIEVAALRGRS